MRHHVETLYPLYDEKIRRYLRFKMHNPGALDDVMQNVWLDILRMPNQTIDYPQQFLRTVALREFINWIEHKDLHARWSLRSTDEAIDPTPGVDNEIEITRALDKLSSDRQRECLLAHAAGYTMDEIGEQLGIAGETVKIHLRRGGAKLRAVLTG